MNNKKSLGAWFPSASVQKTSLPLNCTNVTILLFYHYTKLNELKVKELKEYLEINSSKYYIGGRIRIATEGLNATLSSTKDGARGFAKLLSEWDKGQFNKTHFKYIDDLPIDRAFKELRVLPVKELVFYGINEDNAPLTNGGIHLEPKEYHKKMTEENTVIIDVRNSYEAEIGKFIGQMDQGGAEYIDPEMRKSTDFTEWLRKEEVKEKLKGKQVLLYCTGGIRCERASAYIKTEIPDVVKDVYQLHGGIERYFQEFTDGGFWRGKNFVFDKRESVSVSNKAGVGGVVRSRKKKKKKNKNNNDEEEILGQCCVCNTPWDRYIGKKKCFTCGVPVLMCDKCLSKKVDQIKGRELEVRCPLCKKQNITLPADLTNFTDNGVHIDKSSIKTTNAVASPSVLKWGGGFAQQKKRKRALKRRDCRFGDDCKRKDCWFAHPKDKKKHKANS